MSYGYGDWAPYVSVAERRLEAARTVAKLRKKDPDLAPVMIEGNRIATSFWGKAWCDAIESYRDYEYRLDRGRSYVRQGAVVDLRIAPGQITARVNGSELYHTTITIAATPPAKWRAICAECTGRIESLVELLQGRFSKPVMERLCSQESGLFPRPSEIKFSCSCLDHASMCKHVAAVLYGIGARLDQSPELLFRLRAVDETALLANLGAALPGTGKAPGAGKALAGDDLAALFGLDMADDGAGSAPPPEVAPSAPRKVTAKGTVAKTGSARSTPAPAKPAQKTPTQKALTQKALTQKTPTQKTKAKTTPAPVKAAPKTRSTRAKVETKPAAPTKPTITSRKALAKSVASTQAASPARRQLAAGVETQPTRLRATAVRGRAGGRQARSIAKHAG